MIMEQFIRQTILRHLGRSLVIVLLALCIFPVGPVVAECPIQVMGKLNNEILRQHWEYLQNGDCDECMNTQWPDDWSDYANPFDVEDGDNCNGIRKPWFFIFKNIFTVHTSRRYGSDWTTFTICGGAATLRSTVDNCNLDYNADTYPFLLHITTGMISAIGFLYLESTSSEQKSTSIPM